MDHINKKDEQAKESYTAYEYLLKVRADDTKMIELFKKYKHDIGADNIPVKKITKVNANEVLINALFNLNIELILSLFKENNISQSMVESNKFLFASLLLLNNKELNEYLVDRFIFYKIEFNFTSRMEIYRILSKKEYVFKEPKLVRDNLIISSLSEIETGLKSALERDEIITIFTIMVFLGANQTVMDMLKAKPLTRFGVLKFRTGFSKSTPLQFLVHGYEELPSRIQKFIAKVLKYVKRKQSQLSVDLLQPNLKGFTLAHDLSFNKDLRKIFDGNIPSDEKLEELLKSFQQSREGKLGKIEVLTTASNISKRAKFFKTNTKLKKKTKK